MKIPNWHKKLWKEQSNEKPDMMVFWWGWCKECNSAYLECPKCGNNSCNAGHGIIQHEDGTREACDVCWLSDQYLWLTELAGEYPKTRRQVEYYNNRNLERMGVSIDGVLDNRDQAVGFYK